MRSNVMSLLNPWKTEFLTPPPLNHMKAEFPLGKPAPHSGIRGVGLGSASEPEHRPVWRDVRIFVSTIFRRPSSWIRSSPDSVIPTTGRSGWSGAPFPAQVSGFPGCLDTFCPIFPDHCRDLCITKAAAALSWNKSAKFPHKIVGKRPKRSGKVVFQEKYSNFLE